jgi:hypothetical protein
MKHHGWLAWFATGAALAAAGFLSATLPAVAAGAVKHVLKGTYIDGGAISVAFETPGGGLDTPAAITCPGTKSCTLEAEQVVFVGGSNNQYGICLYVDGKVISAGCLYSGRGAADGSFAMTTITQATTLTPGPHTVQTFLATDVIMDARYYSATYRVYQP